MFRGGHLVPRSLGVVHERKFRIQAPRPPRHQSFFPLCPVRRTSSSIPSRHYIGAPPRHSIEFAPTQVTLTLAPLNPIPMLKTALCQRLLDRERSSDLYYGYLTMDKTRKVVPLLEADPMTLSTPLCGVWVDLTKQPYETLDHPLVWQACMRFLTNGVLPEKVFLNGSCFLVLLVHGDGNFAFAEASLPGGEQVQDAAGWLSRRLKQEVVFVGSLTPVLVCSSLSSVCLHIGATLCCSRFCSFPPDRVPELCFQGTVDLDYDTRNRAVLELQSTEELPSTDPTTPVGINTAGRFGHTHHPYSADRVVTGSQESSTLLKSPGSCYAGKAVLWRDGRVGTATSSSYTGDMKKFVVKDRAASPPGNLNPPHLTQQFSAGTGGPRGVDNPNYNQDIVVNNSPHRPPQSLTGSYAVTK